MGRDLNYRALGHATLLDLLRSMPDTCEVLDTGTGAGSALIKAVASDSTKHIADMVSKQRESKSV